MEMPSVPTKEPEEDINLPDVPTAEPGYTFIQYVQKVVALPCWVFLTISTFLTGKVKAKEKEREMVPA